MKYIKTLFIIFSATLFISSCNVQEVELVSVEKIELVKMENNTLTFDVSAILDNPNSFNIKMIDSDLDLYLEGNLMGKANLINSINIKKKTSETYTFTVKTDVLDQAKLLPILIKTALTGKLKVGVKGDVKGKVYFISKKVKINMEDEISIKDDILKR